MNKKYPLILGAFLLTATTSFAVGTTFKDEATFADWYKDSVKHLQETGVVTGYADGNFLPNNPVTRGELSLMLDRYETNVVNKKIAALSLPAGVTEKMVDEKIKAHFDEHKDDYFDGYIQSVIDNTEAFKDSDIDYKTAIIMAESGLRKLDEAPEARKLEDKDEDANVPENYTAYLFDWANGHEPPLVYLNYKGEKSFGDVIENVDEWYGPF